MHLLQLSIAEETIISGLKSVSGVDPGTESGPENVHSGEHISQ